MKIYGVSLLAGCFLAGHIIPPKLKKRKTRQKGKKHIPGVKRRHTNEITTQNPSSRKRNQE